MNGTTRIVDMWRICWRCCAGTGVGWGGEDLAVFFIFIVCAMFEEVK